MTNYRKIGGKYEKRIAKEFGAEIVRGSGSSLWHKGDVKNSVYCIQCKFTEKKIFSLKVQDLIKAEKEAYSERKDFIFCIGMKENTYVVERIDKILEQYPHIISNNRSIKIDKEIFKGGETIQLTFVLKNKEYNYLITTLRKFQEIFL